MIHTGQRLEPCNGPWVQWGLQPCLRNSMGRPKCGPLADEEVGSFVCGLTGFVLFLFLWGILGGLAACMRSAELHTWEPVQEEP